VSTLVLGERPPELRALIEKRQALGLDGHDEVWEGTYVVSPMADVAHARVQAQLPVLLGSRAQAAGLVESGPFNLGEQHNVRVPDWGFHRNEPKGLCLPTAAVVVEVVSPDDRSYQKFDFYAEHGVGELFIVDPLVRSVRFFRLDVRSASYAEVGESLLLNVSAAGLAEEINWPAG
jgi:Uma2 family endonuclease